MKRMEIKEDVEYIPPDDFVLMYDEVSDEQIKACIEKKAFIDVSDGEHAENTTEHHAIRIASLIHLMMNEKMEFIINVFKESDGGYNVPDGCHRIRAYQYLNKSVPCWVN